MEEIVPIYKMLKVQYTNTISRNFIQTHHVEIIKKIICDKLFGQIRLITIVPKLVVITRIKTDRKNTVIK